MLETRIKFTGKLEGDLKTYIEYQWGDEYGAVNFTIKQALRKFLNEELAEIRIEQRQKERDQLLAKGPELIGKMIARQVVDMTKTPSKEAVYHIEAEKGEAGGVQCPNCGEMIAIGAEEKNAICSKCKTKIQIKRIDKEVKKE